MSDTKSQETQSETNLESESKNKKTTPLQCFLGSITAGVLAFIPYYLMTSIVETYATKPVISTNPIVINITVAVRTLVIGVATLATATFGLVAIGLFLLAIQVTFSELKQQVK
jgi:hypothetical protein